MVKDDVDTIPETGESASELLEAVEWLRQRGFLSGDERPFEALLREGGVL